MKAVINIIRVSLIRYRSEIIRQVKAETDVKKRNNTAPDLNLPGINKTGRVNKKSNEKNTTEIMFPVLFSKPSSKRF